MRACQGFERGGRSFAVAARFMNADGAVTDQRDVNKLLDRGDAGANRDSNLMAAAMADASFIEP